MYMYTYMQICICICTCICIVLCIVYYLLCIRMYQVYVYMHTLKWNHPQHFQIRNYLGVLYKSLGVKQLRTWAMRKPRSVRSFIENGTPPCIYIYIISTKGLSSLNEQQIEIKHVYVSIYIYMYYTIIYYIYLHIVYS